MVIPHNKLLNKALLEGVPGGIVVVNAEGEIVTINDLALELLNIKEENVVGKQVIDVIPNTRIDVILESGRVELNQYQNLNKNRILTNRMPICDQGEIIGAVAYFQEDKEAEEMAKELEGVKRLKKNLETILNSIDDGIHVVDEEGLTIFYNSKMAELENHEKEQVLDEKLLDIFPSLDRTTSTLLRTLDSQKPIMEHEQSYTNYKGEEITTINKTLPITLDNQFIGALEIAKDVTKLKELSEKNLDLQSELYKADDTEKKELNNGTKYLFSDIIGQNWDLKKKIKYAKQASKTSSSVLISGQTGTGKELFAQSIHNSSPRRGKPFIAQNCAALPKDLLEGILFGTKKGGFTGAVDRKGLFEQANGGTILLDEINSMSLELQAKLLRVLQEGMIRYVGGNELIEVDVRVIATINKEPAKAFQAGELREDLYYRLAVVNLQLPSLQERKDDISLLVEYFINKFNRKFNYRISGITKEVEKLFLKYDWPGNVRQLEHVLEGAINIVGKRGKIEEQHVEPFMIDIKNIKEDNEEDNLNINSEESLPELMEDIEKRLIKEAIDDTAGNISQAARDLGVKRQSLQYKINKYSLQT
ncbi:sigma 54-interacting transcriptional regulator [Selenihalanaerobacter shriftii]|uniref:Arginine utilization regulatory protein n=1 Tax=Selenihalanaerobacter shriftii TaxID=142842 RepID=A0A1T4PWY6_9FIRM|nr:sigma 54-interacting transcriptional regulator [Selenihalanaerobacter shriftii]SJZ95985.1 arginine utilization regulatory protein [Selenihalanaerobacter shriftii]